MTKAYVRVKGDPSVGINHQDFTVDNLEFDDAQHRLECCVALQKCFATICGEPKFHNVTVVFDDDYTPEDSLSWKVEGLTDTFENEQRN